MQGLYRQVRDLLPSSLSLSQQDTDLSLFIANTKKRDSNRRKFYQSMESDDTCCIHTLFPPSFCENRKRSEIAHATERLMRSNIPGFSIQQECK